MHRTIQHMGCGLAADASDNVIGTPLQSLKVVVYPFGRSIRLQDCNARMAYSWSVSEQACVYCVEVCSVCVRGARACGRHVVRCVCCPLCVH